MEKPESSKKDHEGSWLWILKILAGLILVIILGIHFLVNHILAPSGLLTYQEVIRYYSYAIVPAMEIIFLFVVIFHSFLGLRSIILDLNPSNRVMMFVDWILVFLGGAAFLYGTWLVLLISKQYL